MMCGRAWGQEKQEAGERDESETKRKRAESDRESGGEGEYQLDG